MSRGQPIEFDQAIRYVTTIKERFKHDPDTYKRFLEILHTYQQESKSIKLVLDAVSQLFCDHSDLLREFIFFLPDTVQPQAKDQLERAVQENERNRSKLIQRPYGHGSSATQAMEQEARRRYDERHRLPITRAEKERKSSKRSRSTLSSGATESLFFEKVRDLLPSRELWNELLKCLDLYSQEVLSRNELLCLVGDLFGKHSDVLQEFKTMLSQRGAVESKAEELWATTALSEMDFSHCRRCTPSYRALPRNYARPASTERSEPDDKLLNDAWVSVPTGSEDFSYKSMRKNPYEEALFKCEDERFEIDMVIDSNSSTISVLEQLSSEIAALQAEDEAKESGVVMQYRLDERSLSTVHLAAITRIYGDRGKEILELMRKNPAGAIPVILKRIKQKDVEWRKARETRNKTWEEILVQNADKALDHRSFYFKQQQKKALAIKNMVEEIKAKHSEEKEAQEAEGASTRKSNEADGTTAMDESSAAAGDESPSAQVGPTWGSKHIVASFDKPEVHFDIAKVLASAAEQSNCISDKQLPAKWWRTFLHQFLGLPPQWLDSAAAQSSGTLLPSSVVSTAYGEGVVECFRDDGIAVVQLPYGKAYMCAENVQAKEAVVPWPAAEAEDGPAGATAASERYCIGTLPMYTFFRMYCVLYDRLVHAKELCEAKVLAERARGNVLNPAIEYLKFLDLLSSLLHGSSAEASEFEDKCRAQLGTQSFRLFTLDKVITRMVKDLQMIVTERNALELQVSDVHTFVFGVLQLANLSTLPGLFVLGPCLPDGLRAIADEWRSRTEAVQDGVLRSPASSGRCLWIPFYACK